MTRRVSFVSVALLVAAVGVALAQAPAPFRRTMLQQVDLSSTPGREVVQAIAEIEPGAASGRHTHPGEEAGYVLEGTIRFELDGQAPVNKKAGDYFFVPAGRTHSATAVGNGTAKVLATYVVEKGKPIATPVP